MFEAVELGNTTSTIAPDGRRFLLEIMSVASLLILYAVIVSNSTFQKTAVFDEPFHITGGYNYLKNGDLKMCSEGGFFTEALLALPLLKEKLNFPYKGGNFFSEADEWETGRDFIFRSGNDADSLILSSRCVVLTISILLGIAVYLISRGAFGHTGGMISLFLYVFSPEILAHGGFATTDMISTFLFIAAAWSVWRLLNKISPSNLFMSSAMLSILFVAKHSAIIIIPFYLILIAIRIFMDRPVEAVFNNRTYVLKSQKSQILAFLAAGAINALAIFFIIWAACGFKYSMLKDDTGTDRAALNQTTESFLQQGGAFGKAISIARDCRILPEAYLYGYAFFLKFGQKRYAFLDGEFSTEGWWYFFIVSFFYKTPLPVLLLAGICIFCLVNRNRSLNDPLCIFRNEKMHALIPFIVFIILYMLFVIVNRSNIGNRHLLPVYPALFILCGYLSTIILEGRKTARWGIFLLLVCTGLTALYAFPNYLSYFNVIAGGQQNGYKHLVDSSCDWGQDLKELKSWLGKNNPGKKEVYFSCFSNSDNGYYGLKIKALPSYRKQKGDDIFELGEGIYCISATMFQFLYISEACFNETGFDTANADDNYFSSLSKEIKALPDSGKISELTAEQRNKYRIYEYLRFIKLCLYLHNREPDANIGGSILVFRLENEDIEKALRD